jgi:hypothetical protein
MYCQYINATEFVNSRLSGLISSIKVTYARWSLSVAVINSMILTSVSPLSY